MDWFEKLEGPTLEFKRALPTAQKFATELIALANTRGGQLIVGYDEKERKIYPVTPSQKQEEWIANVADTLSTPRVPYNLGYESIDGQTLLVIDVPSSQATPHRLKGKSIEDGTYVRVGSTTRKADQETLARLIRQGKNLPFDQEALGKGKDLNPQKIRAYLRERHRRLGGKVPTLSKKLLEDLRLTQGERSTVAGILLFADHPQDKLEYAYIKAGRFRGQENHLLIDQQALLGTLPEQIEGATKFVLRNTPLRSVIQGTKRKDTYMYPEPIIREAIVNAVVHRDYSRSGSSIRLSVFDNRIEVTSPGGLSGPVTVDAIKDRQYSRNPTIAKRMFELGFFEEWGQGIDRILSWSKEAGRRPPHFRDDVTEFTLTLYAETDVDTEGPKSLDTSLSEQILDHLKHQGTITNGDIRTHFSLSKSKAQRILTQLLRSKRIQKHGAGRTTHYTIA